MNNALERRRLCDFFRLVGKNDFSDGLISERKTVAKESATEERIGLDVIFPDCFQLSVDFDRVADFDVVDMGEDNFVAHDVCLPLFPLLMGLL
jgi:hypothetical protein